MMMRHRRGCKWATFSLVLLFVSIYSLFNSFTVSGFHSTPWRHSFCSLENEVHERSLRRRCPLHQPDKRLLRPSISPRSRNFCTYMSKMEEFSSVTVEKAAAVSESTELHDRDDVSDDNFVALEKPDLLLDLLDTNTSDTSVSSLPAISLDNIDLLTESGASNIAYFYLQNEIGLSEEAMWKITHEAGQVLGMTADTLRRKVDLLRRTMNLTDDNVRTILELQPTILQLSADQNLAPTILFLVRALDLSKADLRSMIVQYPCILCYSTKNLKSKLNFFTRLMGYSTDECRKLLVAHPKLLTAGVKTGLLPHLRFFTSDIEVPVDKLRTIIKKNPLLLLYSLEDNLVPKLIFFMTMNLRMNSSQVLRTLTNYPQFLDYNLDNHILPITAFLMQELEYSPIEVRQILLSFPRLVTHSLRKIKHVVSYLRFELGLEAAQVKRVLYQAPQAIGVNTENTLKKKVAFLRDELELDHDELRRVITGMPTLLICSIEKNLQPKIDYLRQVFGDNDEGLREAVLTLPALLGYSLKKRIMPRMEELLEIGGKPESITIGIPMKEEAFIQWLEGLERRLEKGYTKQQGAEQTSAIVHVGKKDEGDGRVTHWTRERRPPSQRS